MDPVAERLLADTHGLTVKPLSWNPLGLGILLGLCAAIVVGNSQPASAEDVMSGQKIFSQNCTKCHVGGYNNVRPEKKLTKDALVRFKRYQINDIVDQITYGNGAMPAFGGVIKAKDIRDVALYVRRQADTASLADTNARKLQTDSQPGGIKSSKPKPQLYDWLIDEPAKPQKRELQWGRKGGKNMNSYFS